MPIQQQLNYSLLNLDYNSIQNKQQLLKIIYQSKAIIQNKIRNINELSQLRDRGQSQRQIIINRMRENTQQNAQLIQQYKSQLFNVNENYEEFLKSSQQQKDKQKKNIEIMHQLQVNQINKKIQQLQAEYRKLRQSQDKQAGYISKIQDLKKGLIVKQYQHNDNMNKQEGSQVKQNKELERKFKGDISESKKNAHNQAIVKISAQVQTNQEQNVKLKQKLLQLQSQLGKLKKDRNQILVRRKQLKINVTLNEQQLQQYKAVGSLQKAKIKAHKDKIQNMKLLISEQVSKKEKTLADHRKTRQSHLKTLKLRLFNLDKQRQQLKANMQKLAILGQTILQQRSQIQQFFIMALEACKKQIQEQYANKSQTQTQQQKNYGEKVDIDELLPKDKQRILTNLYTKLAFGMK